MQSQQAVAEFGPIRRILWPIHNFELKKLLPMFFMFFFISLNYSIVRNIKDALVVNAPLSGAETLSYIKLWGVVPAAIIFMLIFSKMSNVLSKQKLFYASILPFVLFFTLFTLVLYPAHEAIHPIGFGQQMVDMLPAGFQGFVAMICNWSYSLFYIFAELWGSVVLSLLFWGFANDTTKVEESKRFYALFGIGANLALEVAGRFTQFFSSITDKLPAGVDPMQYSLDYLIAVFVVSALSIMFLYWWINRYVLTDPRFYDPSKIKKKKSKAKMSLKDSFNYLFKSKYLLYIAILVMAYGVSINLIEVAWKSQLKELYPSMTDYLNFMGSYNRYVGWATIFMMLFVSGNVIRFFGWRFAALITPTALLVTGAAFFGIVIFRDQMPAHIDFLGISSLTLAVIIGTIQNVISKSSKYSLFDPTKEMTYIPLDQEEKVKGKAAIDVVGARLGKAGGSLIQQGLFMFGSLAVVTPYLAVIVGVVIVMWIKATNNLSKEFSMKM